MYTISGHNKPILDVTPRELVKAKIEMQKKSTNEDKQLYIKEPNDNDNDNDINQLMQYLNLPNVTKNMHQQS